MVALSAVTGSPMGVLATVFYFAYIFHYGAILSLCNSVLMMILFMVTVVISTMNIPTRMLVFLLSTYCMYNVNSGLCFRFACCTMYASLIACIPSNYEHPPGLVSSTSVPTVKKTPVLFTQKDKKSQRGSECKVCQENEATLASPQCGHLCLCFKCGNAILQMDKVRCPMCRTEIKTNLLRIYK